LIVAFIVIATLYDVSNLSDDVSSTVNSNIEVSGIICHTFFYCFNVFYLFYCYSIA